MNIYCASCLWCAARKGCRENKVGKSWCRHFWPDWHLQQVIHSEREAQVPRLLLPAQVYDNPNKLWCTAQTLKTLIGTKSNRLCLSGQRELREWLCVCALSPPLPPNYQFLFVLKSCITSGPPTHFSLRPSFGSICDSPLLFVVLCVPHIHLLLTWSIQQQGKMSANLRHGVRSSVPWDRVRLYLPGIALHVFLSFFLFLFAGDLIPAGRITRLTPTTLILTEHKCALCRLFHHHQL